MAITKETEIGQIEVVTPYKHVQVRTDTVIREDGVELARSFHRHVVQSNISAEDLSKEHADVQTIANSGIWTQEIKDAWIAKVAEHEG